MSGRRASKLEDQLTAARITLKMLSDGLVRDDPSKVLERAANEIAGPVRVMMEKGEGEDARARLIAARDTYEGPGQEAWVGMLNAVLGHLFPKAVS